MSSSRIMVALVGIGAFVAGIWVGAFISSPAPQHASADSSAAGTNASSSAPAGKVAGPENSATKFDASLSGDTLIEKFWTTLTMADERERQAAWFTMLGNLTPANAMEIRELFRKMDAQGRWFIPEWNAFWARWGEVDGPAALEHIKTIDMPEYQPMLAERVLKGWTMKDPANARTWLKANTGSPWYDSALSGYLDGLARTNLDRATQDALALGKGHDMGRLTEALTEQALQQRQLNGMVEWWRSLPEDSSEGSARREAIAHVYQRLQTANDGRAAEWLAEVANTPFYPEEQIGNLAEKIAGKNPTDALDWVTSLPPSPSNGHYTAIGRTINALAQRDPVAVENWLNQIPPSPLRDQGLVAYARHLDRNSKAEAAQQWRSQVEDQQLLQPNRAADAFGRAFQAIEIETRITR